MKQKPPLIVSSNDVTKVKTRRPGLSARRFLTPADTLDQNVALMEADEGAEIESHVTKTSESFYILEGDFEIILEDCDRSLKPGDFCYFYPDTTHGLRCLKGPGRFLVIFAPAFAPDAKRS